MTKGRKRTKGIPDLHDELKTRVNLSLTPKAIAGLDLCAAEHLISRSELVERIGRGLIPIAQMPSVHFNRRETLPERPGVGVLVSGSQILYIGQGIELKRMEASSLGELDVDNDSIRIIWIDCSEPSWLPLIETALVAVYGFRLQGNQSSSVNVENFSKWIGRSVLENLPTAILSEFKEACAQVLYFRGFLPAAYVPDITTGDDEGGIKITTLFEYSPTPRWLKALNGGMYEVSSALLDDEELHKLPEDLQQRVLKLRTLENTKHIEAEPVTELLREGSNSES